MKPPPVPDETPVPSGILRIFILSQFFPFVNTFAAFFVFFGTSAPDPPAPTKIFSGFPGKIIRISPSVSSALPRRPPPVFPRRPKRFRFQGRRFSLRIMYSHASAKRTLRPGIPHAARAMRAKNQTVKGETRRNAPLCAKFPPCRSDSRRAPPQSRPPPIFSLRAKSALFARNRRKEGSRDATK